MNSNFWLSREGSSRHQTNRDMGYEGSSTPGQKRSHHQLGGTSVQETPVLKKQATASYKNIPSHVMQKMFVPPMTNFSKPFSASERSDHSRQPHLLIPVSHPFSAGFGDHSRHGRVTTDVSGKLQTHVIGSPSFLKSCPFSTEISGRAWSASRENFPTFTRIKNSNPIPNLSDNRFHGRKHPGINFTLRGRRVEKSRQNWKIMASEFDEDGEGFFSAGPCLHELHLHPVNISTEPEKHNLKLETCPPDRYSKRTESPTESNKVGFSHKEADTRLTLSNTCGKKDLGFSELNAAHKKISNEVPVTASAPDDSNERNLLDESAYDTSCKAVQQVELAYDKFNSKSLSPECSTPSRTQRDTALTGPNGNFSIINSSDVHGSNFTFTLINNPSPDASSADTHKMVNLADFCNSSSTKISQITRYENSSNTDHVYPVSPSKVISKAVTSTANKPRTPANYFPFNVKSLLSTGIFDGIHVKYVSWDRKKSVRGTIEGAGYLCGCKECNAMKIVNAFDLEMHAGCKSKHPNNHIYFSNGKNMYSVVQELRSISSQQLPEAIRTITGSPIHETNFSLWKASLQAANLEIEQPYLSKDD